MSGNSSTSGYYTSTANCVSVTPECPVEATVYGYYPSLGANAFFCAYFAVFLAANIILMVRYRSWRFTPWVAIGALSEMLGYVGRCIMYGNPWSNSGFELQICTLIFAPSFFAAAIYITLKHLIRCVGPAHSPLPAPSYPYIFIFCDFTSLLLQAIGGGIAASSTTDSGSALGGHIMLAGIVFQVATFTLLYVLLGIYIVRFRRSGGLGGLERGAEGEEGKHRAAVVRGRDFKVFVGGIFVASLAIYVRCVYRIAELQGGWANPIMRDEDEFVVLDGVMCCIAVLGLTICHPGIWFKPMVEKTYASTSESAVGKTSAGSSQEDVEK